MTGFHPPQHPPHEWDGNPHEHQHYQIVMPNGLGAMPLSALPPGAIPVGALPPGPIPPGHQPPMMQICHEVKAVSRPLLMSTHASSLWFSQQRLTREQHDYLERHFQVQHKPTTTTKKLIAESMHVPLDKINVRSSRNAN
jgi:hypothetical protein